MGAAAPGIGEAAASAREGDVEAWGNFVGKAPANFALTRAPDTFIGKTSGEFGRFGAVPVRIPEIVGGILSKSVLAPVLRPISGTERERAADAGSGSPHRITGKTIPLQRNSLLAR